MFTADGETLTPAGRRLLAHELTHTWQYERFGPGYVGEALNDGDFGGDDETYEFRDDLEAGTAFLDMETEAQASLIEAVYGALVLSDDGLLSADLSLGLFCRETLVRPRSAAAIPRSFRLQRPSSR